MVYKLKQLSKEELNKIKQIIGEAFISNELFHNWGSEDERKEDVMKYMSIFVDYAYKTGNLYSTSDMTGFIGLEDTKHLFIFARIKMILKMLTRIKKSRVKLLLEYIKQINKSNEIYKNTRHLDTLMVCVKKEEQGKGIAKELIDFAKEKANNLEIPLLFDTDMEGYSSMYQHLGCKLYNSITADNGVTRYSLCYEPDEK